MNKYILLLFLAISLSSFSQENKEINYYVSSKVLNVRSGASSDSSIVFKLNQHDNIIYLGQSENSNWAKVNYNGKIGYVYNEYIKKGKCIVSTYTIRVGAVCKDGTRSSATGRGACSHHGGVSYWLTEQKKSIRIDYN